MPNIASVLKSEIARVARKEIRAQIEALKKSVATYRSDIAVLKRRTQSVEQELHRLQKSMPKPVIAPVEASAASPGFSPKSLASQRQRLELTADECGLVLGTSGKSIYRWENGKAVPRTAYLPAIGALRTLSREQAAEVVASRRKKK